MNAFLQSAIESTIRNTLHLVESGAMSWSDARPGVLRVMRDLGARFPMQRGVVDARLGAFVAEQDARHRGEPANPQYDMALH